MISVVCPFYNEEAILEKAILHMLSSLESLDDDWELVVVNDGSLDSSPSIAQALAQQHDRLRLEGYEVNQGRGAAIRHGVAAARGELVVVTEVDCSWGDRIVHEIIAQFRQYPKTDMVIASPNLPSGGYRNVPQKRVMISRLGNHILRVAQSKAITMYTGMTRGYRKEKFMSLPLTMNGKEMHLEVVQQALALGFTIREVPAWLEWKDHKLAKPNALPRKSSSKIPKLIQSHLMFSLVTAPFRYIFPAALGLLLMAIFFAGWSFVNLGNPDPSIYTFLVAILLFLFAFLVLTMGVISHQNLSLHKELWRVRSSLQEITEELKKKNDKA
ncbi:glycosyltransferase family 2 protein [Magnetococcus sp. PR-3]|uniref:glycosyltransferase family 2 protein n=1 Tax=Magnetococcus sp. PR-3 TaxID=3120355 RepID=UPI002FCE4C2C